MTFFSRVFLEHFFFRHIGKNENWQENLNAEITACSYFVYSRWEHDRGGILDSSMLKNEEL